MSSKGKAKEALVGNKKSQTFTSDPPSLLAEERKPLGHEDDDEDDDEVMISNDTSMPEQNNDAISSDVMSLDPNLKPSFQPLSRSSAQSARDAMDVTRGSLRKVPIPPHRMSPLKNEWPKIYTPLVEMAGLQVRMNVKRKTVEIKVRLFCFLTRNVPYLTFMNHSHQNIPLTSQCYRKGLIL